MMPLWGNIKPSGAVGGTSPLVEATHPKIGPHPIKVNIYHPRGMRTIDQYSDVSSLQFRNQILNRKNPRSTTSYMVDDDKTGVIIHRCKKCPLNGLVARE